MKKQSPHTATGRWHVASVFAADAYCSKKGVALAQKVAQGIKSVAEGETPVELDSGEMAVEARKSVKEKSVTCLECGQSFKILTTRHLASHGMTSAEYREKWGFKKDAPLVCKALQRERRKKMKDMKLWEKRRKVQESPA